MFKMQSSYVDPEMIRQSIESIFGKGVTLTIGLLEQDEITDGKVLQYSSEIEFPETIPEQV
jgi:hypothetical protein